MEKSVTILVVDDEVDIVETYKMLFELHGYAVATATNGLDAMAVVAQTIPDLIISDCMMPHMDGVELTRLLRANPALKATPIILMSGAPELHDISTAPHDIFLRKPLFFDQLIREVRRLLAESHGPE